MVILPPCAPPTSSAAIATDVPRIKFRHPAYPDSAPDLLCLSAVDGDDGVDYDIALLACCIVTGNTWRDISFAVKVNSHAVSHVSRPANGVLRGRVFYFRLKGYEPNEKYPVIPSFDHWRFPHDEIPHLWSDLTIPHFAAPPILKHKPAAMFRNKTCRMSGYVDATEAAHLVPLAAGHWFNPNDIKRYCCLAYDAFPINDENNLLLLRKDIHHLFDQRRFTFAPKKPDDDTPPHLVTHVLPPHGSVELVSLYHNRILHPLSGVSVKLLLARFAWSIFTDEIFPFFSGTQEYAVLLFDLETGKAITNRLRPSQIRARSSMFEAFTRS
ncbi:hypothetical protein QBC33DRAFT_461377 [Phialemonium atrogriseum]|uniref:HNH nuclease domain-containing protein n=1 Tax=Phialemonium atrogriseum TaxID=1093897 RepID=A0AAJ0FIU8_9PEZI|nr:uncharacterized protein QBC33DRAFT_461377 [Phialemonium atrogriseum]KAK1762450.1 hypothetical protein QBC33DRAFT_461377 [Phialemonium atrogriseum]